MGTRPLFKVMYYNDTLHVFAIFSFTIDVVSDMTFQRV